MADSPEHATRHERKILLKAIANECDSHEDFLSASIEHVVERALVSAFKKGVRSVEEPLEREKSRENAGVYLLTSRKGDSEDDS